MIFSYPEKFVPYRNNTLNCVNIKKLTLYNELLYIDEIISKLNEDNGLCINKDGREFYIVPINDSIKNKVAQNIKTTNN